MRGVKNGQQSGWAEEAIAAMDMREENGLV